MWHLWRKSNWSKPIQVVLQNHRLRPLKCHNSNQKFFMYKNQKQFLQKIWKIQQCPKKLINQKK
uniref:Neurofilament medium polypeptide-like n=1 Tax=Rhizophora mucronata TaxID=61149 RepID=A0A2P2KFU6_RHIMU